jgi:hypothetical protein
VARIKLIKSFVHNLADSYMSTLGWVDGDYKSTWLYRVALESGVHDITFDIRNSVITPKGLKHEVVLLKSLANLTEHFDSMLKTQGVEPSFVPVLTFNFSVPVHSQRELHILCNATATDITGKEHIAALIENRYGYEILAT